MGMLVLPAVADIDADAGAWQGVAGGIAQQVGQGPAHQRRIDLGLRVADHFQAQIGIERDRFIELDHILGHGGEADDTGLARADALVGPREKEHVAHHRSHAAQVLQVGLQHLAHILNRAGFAQDDFGAGDQGGQRRVELVRHIGVEGFQLEVGVGQAIEQGVELCDDGQQLLGQAAAVKTALKIPGRQHADLRDQRRDGPQAALHQQAPKQGQQQGARHHGGKQGPAQSAQQGLVGPQVHHQGGSGRARLVVLGSGDADGKTALHGVVVAPVRWDAVEQHMALVVHHADGVVAMAGQKVGQQMVQGLVAVRAAVIAQHMHQGLLLLVEHLLLAGRQGAVKHQKHHQAHSAQAQHGQQGHPAREPAPQVRYGLRWVHGWARLSST